LHHTVQNALLEKCRFLVISGISEKSIEEKTLKLIKSSGAIVVFMDGSSDIFDSVRIYRENGMYQAVRLLLMSGCENILFYNSSTFDNPNDRLRGAMAAYESMGLPVSSINLWPFDEKMSVLKQGFSVGYEVTMDVLDSRPVDGLFCSNDELAIGALAAIREKGLRVPEDIKVVGFDNIPESKYTAPPLSTVGQPVENMTDAVIELCRRREETMDAKPESLVFPTNLIARESAPLPDPKLRGEIFMELV
jgi:LacI family transcriptional regulator